MELTSLARVEGPNLVLRLIRPEDAAYVYGLRTNPAYNRYLSEVRGTVEDQRRWIEAYKTREVDGNEYYYVIERHEGMPCGAVRLYDIGQDGFTWGSWILADNQPRRAALESAVLSFGVGFRLLGRQRAFINVRFRNDRAIAFYRRFGMTEIDRTQDEIHFVYSRIRYEADVEQFVHRLSSTAKMSEFQQ